MLTRMAVCTRQTMLKIAGSKVDGDSFDITFHVESYSDFFVKSEEMWDYIEQTLDGSRPSRLHSDGSFSFIPLAWHLVLVTNDESAAWIKAGELCHIALEWEMSKTQDPDILRRMKKTLKETILLYIAQNDADFYTVQEIK